MEINLADDENYRQMDTIHVMRHWRSTVTITVKYLRNIDALFVKWKMHYTIMTLTDDNHALT